MEKAYNYMDKPMMRENPALLFHKRMGHLSRERLLKAFKDGGDHGIKGLTEKLIKELPWCADCAATKQTRKGHPRQAKNRKRSTQLNAVVHTDTMERVIYGMPPGNYRKTQVFVDECSRYIWVRFLRGYRGIAVGGLRSLLRPNGGKRPPEVQPEGTRPCSMPSEPAAAA